MGNVSLDCGGTVLERGENELISSQRGPQNSHKYGNLNWSGCSSGLPSLCAGKETGTGETEGWSKVNLFLDFFNLGFKCGFQVLVLQVWRATGKGGTGSKKGKQ